MFKKVRNIVMSVVLAASMFLPGAVPATAVAAAPTQEGHGLTGAWYRAKDVNFLHSDFRFSHFPKSYFLQR